MPFSLDKTQSLWLLNAVSICYGTNTTFLKGTIEQSHVDPFLISTIRYDLAALILLPFLLRPGFKHFNWGLAFELGYWLCAAYAAQAQELFTSTASEGSILLAVYLVLVPIVELSIGRPFTEKKAVSLAVACFGVALLAIGGSGGEEEAATAVKTYFGVAEGTWWGLLSSIMFAIHLVRSEVRQHEATDVLQLGAGQLFIVAVMQTAALAVMIPTNPQLVTDIMHPATTFATMPWGLLALTIFVGTAFGQTGELVAVGKIPSSTASLTLSLVVVWGLFCGAIVNHDKLTPVSWAGAAAIIAATIVPKALDVLADRRAAAAKKAADEAAQAAKIADLAPVQITSEEFVRTAVSATMLAATPIMTDTGVLATAGSLGAASTEAATAAAIGRATAMGASQAISGTISGAGVAASEAVSSAALSAGAAETVTEQAIAGAVGRGVGLAKAGATAAGTAAGGAAATSAATATSTAAAAGSALSSAASTTAATTSSVASTAATAAGSAAASTSATAASAASGLASATTASTSTIAATGSSITAAAGKVAGAAGAAAAAAVAAGAAATGDMPSAVAGAVDTISQTADVLALGASPLLDAVSSVTSALPSPDSVPPVVSDLSSTVNGAVAAFSERLSASATTSGDLPAQAAAACDGAGSALDVAGCMATDAVENAQRSLNEVGDDAAARAEPFLQGVQVALGSVRAALQE